MKTFQQFQESGGETVDGKFMSYATMKAKGIKPKKSCLLYTSPRPRAITTSRMQS